MASSIIAGVPPRQLSLSCPRTKSYEQKPRVKFIVGLNMWYVSATMPV